MCVPTSSRVSREAISRSGSNPEARLGQAVADLLQPAGQPRVVEHEPDVVFDDPQALARPVGRGVEDPAQVDRSRRVGPGRAAASRRSAGSAPMAPARSPPRSRATVQFEPAAASRCAADDDSAIRRGQQVLGADLGSHDRALGPASLASARTPRGPPSGRSARLSGGRPTLRRRLRSRGSKVASTAVQTQGHPAHVGSSPNRTRSSAARLSASSASAASRSTGSTVEPPRDPGRATRPDSRPALPPAVKASNISSKALTSAETLEIPAPPTHDEKVNL